MASVSNIVEQFYILHRIKTIFRLLRLGWSTRFNFLINWLFWGKWVKTKCRTPNLASLFWQKKAQLYWCCWPSKRGKTWRNASVWLWLHLDMTKFAKKRRPTNNPTQLEVEVRGSKSSHSSNGSQMNDQKQPQNTPKLAREISTALPR